jgi:hypothetical protein
MSKSESKKKEHQDKKDADVIPVEEVLKRNVVFF